MNTIGLRASPSEITYAIYDTEQLEIVSVNCIVYPSAMSTPEALKYVRNTVLDIIREYEISRAGIRIMETVAQSFPLDRVQIEGVLQEALASSAVEKYYCGRIANISAKVGIAREAFKQHVKNNVDFAAVENWLKHNEKEREAILTALGAVNA